LEIINKIWALGPLQKPMSVFYIGCPAPMYMLLCLKMKKKRSYQFINNELVVMMAKKSGGTVIFAINIG